MLDAGIVLPQEDFLTFRAACKRLLDEAAFVAVNAIYVDAHRATQSCLVCRRWRERPDRDEIARQLQELIGPSCSAAETTIRLRAAQAAYFVDGAVVQLTGARPPKVGDVGAVGLNRRTADRLRRLVTPTSACALALTVVGRLSALELRSLTLQHVHGDGAEVVVGDRHIDLPVHVAGLVGSNSSLAATRPQRTTRPSSSQQEARRSTGSSSNFRSTRRPN